VGMVPGLTTLTRLDSRFRNGWRLRLRIPMMATARSGGWRPRIPIDDDRWCGGVMAPLGR
ncbi:MAG TPA: hypothetical protein VGE92_12335, partial [Steroidobacteraceae bacterium]